MKCSKCEGEASRTNWIPPKGYDPYLHEYKCGRCGLVFYVAKGDLKESNTGQKVKSFVSREKGEKEACR